MTDKPTDEELENLFVEETGFDTDDFPAAIFGFARAVLAKWGQPAQETNGRKVFVCTHCDGVYADQPVTQCDCLPDENTFTEGWICFGAPAQAAEPVARLVIGKTKGGVSLTHMVVPAAYQLQEGTYALYTAPQPVAREQLTDGQIQDLLLCGNPTDEEMRLIRIGWEAANGIKGENHDR